MPERMAAVGLRAHRGNVDHDFGPGYARADGRTVTHLSLNKDAPLSRPIQTIGRIFPRPILGGLHHHYVRI
jgi:hypothetical protein